MGRVNEQDAHAVTAAKFRAQYEDGVQIQTKQLDVYDLMLEDAPVQTCEIIARYRQKYGANKEQAKGLVNSSLQALKKQGKVENVSRGIWVRLKVK